jgi:hypothetical protein
MRVLFPSIVMFPTLLLAEAEPGSFASVRGILETRCLECHHPGKVKADLQLHTREAMILGGESGTALKPGEPEGSDLLIRTRLPAHDSQRMPPRKHGDSLAPQEIDALAAWIKAGAPWPEGVVLEPMAQTALPRWDAAPDPNLTAIEIHPKEIRLETAADFHRAIAIVRMKDESTHDITRLAKWSIDDPAIAALHATTVTPKKDGKTILRLEYRGLKAEIPVIVKDAEKPRPVSFQLDVMPVLTASGCNTGSCHGSARGQDGFHLSLYGFDPKGDHFRLTHEMAGRRINTALPEESLLLTKAVGSVPHTGGKLIKVDSASYQTLLAWIKNGAPYDAGDISQPTSIEVLPKQFVLTGEEVRVPMTVRATYSDGTDRDVTPLTTFTTSNDNSVAIGKTDGMAVSKNRGEAFLLARFHTFTEGSQAIVVPKDLPYTRPQLPEFNYIDTLVHAKLNKLRVIPSGLADDETFMRRVYLDVVGLPPSIDERKRFLDDKRPEKRAALVDELLGRKEFTEIWVMKWAELLQIRTFNNGPQQVSYKAALNYYQWLRERIASGTPFNEIIRQILSAKGGTFSSPATNYFQIEQDVLKLTENTAQVFMGTRIQCAQCHNHPFDRWTMDDYYGFVSFFAQVKRKPAEDPRERIVFDGGGETQHPVTKQNMKPKFLGGPAPELKNESRREALAKWLASGDNPWFAKNAVNIMWSHFFGIGIVDPVDDIRISNPPSNPELLDELAKRFVSYNYDLKKIVRDICTSRTYQLSTRPNETNATDTRNFSRAIVRRVRAEVLLDCISQITHTPNKFKGLPLGARAVQIADGNTSNYFLTTFGRATRATVCSCEVKMEPNLSQALHLLNGDTTQQRIRQGKVVETMLAENKPPRDIIRHLYLTTLSREPTDMEFEKLLATLPDPKHTAKTREALEDIFWALLNSKEFIFNH